MHKPLLNQTLQTCLMLLQDKHTQLVIRLHSISYSMPENETSSETVHSFGLQTLHLNSFVIAFLSTQYSMLLLAFWS